jgi:hypothetical protein
LLGEKNHEGPAEGRVAVREGWRGRFFEDFGYSQGEVVEKCESSSRENVGIVTVKTSGYKQVGTVVITFKRTLMVYKRAYSLTMHRPSLIGDTEGGRT